MLPSLDNIFTFFFLEEQTFGGEGGGTRPDVKNRYCEPLLICCDKTKNERKSARRAYHCAFGAHHACRCALKVVFYGAIAEDSEGGVVFPLPVIINT